MNENKNHKGTISKWKLSKWFIYVVVFIILFIFSVLTNYYALQLFPTSIELLITFGLFYVFFDLREKLESKTVRDRVKQRIGRQFYRVFADVLGVCDVGVTFDGKTEEDYKKFQRRQLNELVTKELKINDAYKTKESLIYGQLFEELEHALEGIEVRYEKFLSSYLKNSLFKLEDYLHMLSFMYMQTNIKNGDRLNIITDYVRKIMNEINEMQKQGIDVGF